MAKKDEKRQKIAKTTRLVSEHIRLIALEKTELITDPEQGDVIVTKAAALAREIWRRALGYTEELKKATGLVEVVHGPDKSYVNLVLDRLEGTARPVVGGAGKRSVTQKVSEQSQKRINDILDKGKPNDDSGN